MSLLIKGVTSLSKLLIDISKNWGGFKIKNIGTPDNDEDVPRRDTIDGKITTHAAIAAAHHARYTDGEAQTVADTQIAAHAIGAKHRWTLNKLLQGAGAGADPTEIDVSGGGGLGIFGDGSDGDVTIADDTDLARDMFYNSLTVNVTKTLNPKGYRIFVKETLTNNGVISSVGGDGGNGGDGSAGVGGAAGAAGAVSGGSGSLGSGVNGKVGAVGQGGNSNGSEGTIGANQSTPSLGGNGSGGGNGGDTTLPIAHAGGLGAAGGTVAGPTTKDGFKTLPWIIILKELESTIKKVLGGASGGSAGSGANASAASQSASGGGGGSGASGGVIVICAKTIINNGIITCAGGKGGDAGLSWRAAAGNQGAGGSGGGGGGGGGVLIIVYNTVTWGTETVAGGLGGSKSLKAIYGTGVADDGTDGVAGSDGLLIKLANS